MSSGSIRAIRNGADFTELAQIEGAGNFTAIFPLRETVEARYGPIYPEDPEEY